MKILQRLKKYLEFVFVPIRKSATFFTFMYLLGILSAFCTLPDTDGAELYGNLFLELFVDLYCCCAVLLLIPRIARRWITVFLYIILYVVALIDVYCFVNFDSTLNPSMLMLVGETDSREVGDFLSSLVSPDLLFSRVGWILLLAVVNIIVSWEPHIIKKVKGVALDSYLKVRNQIIGFFEHYHTYLSLFCVVILIWGAISSVPNKIGCWKLMTGRTIGEVEHTLTEKDHGQMYIPIYRLIFSAYANTLAAQQIGLLIKAADKVSVDSCSYRSPNIVLIIGESYGKHHSQQYGYPLETTPRQVRLEKSGFLTKFDDVITCWNLTSFVFKNVFSLHVIGEKGEWCDYPLFPEVFRKAGYHVSFITNQFLPKAKEAVYDFSGGFFLNNPKLSKEQFDTRNTSLHYFDEDLLKDYDQLKSQNGKYNLTIFHLIGQHVNYRTRFRNSQTHFYASTYDEMRPELTNKQKKVLSYYDNAVLYNDSVVYQIVKKFKKQDAIVIYMPDHGEECYEENRGFICRNHSANIDWPLAHYEFEIPFWIYCSPKYAHNHPEIFQQIVQARHRRFMTDALPHLLLYLAGIHTKDYHDEYNLLSPNYKEDRPRILKNTTDYDQLREEHFKEMKRK